MDIHFANMINDDDTSDLEMNDDDVFLNPYNYCDYWCEKCIAQERCLFYNKELDAEAEAAIDGEMFQMGEEKLETAIDIIRQCLENNNSDISGLLEEVEGFDYEAEEDDDDDDEEDDDEEDDEEEDEDYLDKYADYLEGDDYCEDYEYYEEEEEEDDDEDDLNKKIFEEVEAHPLRLMCFHYLEKSAEFFTHYNRRYLTPSLLSEAFSNLSWYRTLLPVKMHRTLHSLFEFGAKEEDFLLKDALLTSLIVYKSLSISLSAVKELKSNLVDYQEILTELENILVTIKTGLRHEFPFWIMLWILCIYLSPSYCVVNN